ncbi:hypothetical protein V5O48_011537 [Marasmius crinis-equi]|uniref:Uncharacterized protein n=1 Tax=Marasmius crinis-equi TaxID=585013 RepID=A0ABR3F5D2_9AGAR
MYTDPFSNGPVSYYDLLSPPQGLPTMASGEGRTLDPDLVQPGAENYSQLPEGSEIGSSSNDSGLAPQSYGHLNSLWSASGTNEFFTQENWNLFMASIDDVLTTAEEYRPF